jgi:peptidoglycan hydrolase-like protein with peptidoglycan-binding domain
MNIMNNNINSIAEKNVPGRTNSQSAKETVSGNSRSLAMKKDLKGKPYDIQKLMLKPDNNSAQILLTEEQVTVAANFNSGMNFPKNMWKEIQAKASASPDGAPGRDTAKKIASYQKMNGLSINGKADIATVDFMKINFNKYGLSPVLYMGLNEYATDESGTLKSVSEEGVASITNNKPDAQGIIKTGGKNYDLKTDEGVDAFVDSMKISSGAALKDFIKNNVTANARDEFGKLAMAFCSADRGMTRIRRLVISGHHAGQYIWGGHSGENGQIDFDFIDTLGKVFPNAAAQVEDLMFSACFSGGETQMTKYRDAFPNLKTIWGYTEFSPGTWTGAMTHMKKWEKATEGSDPSKVKKDLAKGTPKGESVAVWTSAAGYQGNNQMSFDEVMERVRQAEPVFTAYFNGDQECSDPHAGPLVEFYINLNRVITSPEMTDSALKKELERKRDITLRLRFYKNIKAKFMQVYGSQIKSGYDEIKETMPVYDKLPRKDIIFKTSEFSGKIKGAKSQTAYNLLENGLHKLDPGIIPASWA